MTYYITPSEEFSSKYHGFHPEKKKAASKPDLSFDEEVEGAEHQHKKSIIKSIKNYFRDYKVLGESELDDEDVAVKKASHDFFKRKDLLTGSHIEYMH